VNADHISAVLAVEIKLDKRGLTTDFRKDFGGFSRFFV
jgi:hypothetical protein